MDATVNVELSVVGIDTGLVNKVFESYLPVDGTFNSVLISGISNFVFANSGISNDGKDNVGISNSGILNSSSRFTTNKVPSC